MAGLRSRGWGSNQRMPGRLRSVTGEWGVISEGLGGLPGPGRCRGGYGRSAGECLRVVAALQDVHGLLLCCPLLGDRLLR